MESEEFKHQKHQQKRKKSDTNKEDNTSKFILSLMKLFENSSDPESSFRSWLHSFLQSQDKKSVNCRHEKVRPLDTVACTGWGSLDGKKGRAMRKTTIWNHACKFLNITQEIEGGQNNLRVHQLSILENFELPIKEAKKAFQTNLVVGHLCGCGSSDKGGCTEPKHLVYITQAQNRDEVVLHELLTSCLLFNEDLYNQQVAVFKKTK
jgi:hypothetical protein